MLDYVGTICLDRTKWKERKLREMEGLHFPNLDTNRRREGSGGKWREEN